MKNKKVKKIIYNIIIIAILLVGLGFVFSSFIHFGNVEFTDNAHVMQHITPVNSRVQGFVKEVRFKEFQHVKKGDTLAIIEDSEFRLHLAQAEAALCNALAGRKASSSGIATTQNNITVNEAGIDEAKAQMDNAKRELERFDVLLHQEAATQQQYDNVRTAYDAARARYEQMLRSKQSTVLAKNEQTVRLDQSDANINVAKAAVELARLNLSYTVITATCDGVLGKKDIMEGQLIQPGQTIVNIVDKSDLWVVANYRETQLHNINVGAEVKVSADALPGVSFTGHVESISDATGSAASIIPQDNATGNFVKVEQRVPVRISLSGNDAEALDRLRAGLNVECEIKY